VENTLVSPFLAIHLLVKNVKELFFIVAGSLDNKIKLSLSVIHLRLRYITATNTCFSQNCIFFSSIFCDCVDNSVCGKFKNKKKK